MTDTMSKKIKILFPYFILLVSCGGSGSSSGELNQEEIDQKYAAGKAVYDRSCISCHQPDGKGMEPVFPPLAGSDYLLEDKTRAIHQVIHGMEGPVVVNNVEYNGIMPPQQLSNEEVRDVMNYVLNSWGNSGGEVTIQEVEKEAL